MQPTIYCIENKINNKKYIGSTKSPQRRWYIHKYLLKKQKHPNIHLQFAWNKYGENAFVFSILETDFLLEDMLSKEKNYIDNFDTLNRQKGYNIAADTKSPMLGRQHTIISKNKMKEAKLGIKNNFYNRKHSQETIKILREQKKGKKLKEEHRQKVIRAIAKSGEQNINSKLSYEDVKKIREEYKNSIKYKGLIKNLSLKFKISSSTIRRILNNQLWKEETSNEDAE